MNKPEIPQLCFTWQDKVTKWIHYITRFLHLPQKFQVEHPEVTFIKKLHSSNLTVNSFFTNFWDDKYELYFNEEVASQEVKNMYGKLFIPTIKNIKKSFNKNTNFIYHHECSQNIKDLLLNVAKHYDLPPTIYVKITNTNNVCPMTLKYAHDKITTNTEHYIFPNLNFTIVINKSFFDLNHITQEHYIHYILGGRLHTLDYFYCHLPTYFAGGYKDSSKFGTTTINSKINNIQDRKTYLSAALQNLETARIMEQGAKKDPLIGPSSLDYLRLQQVRRLLEVESRLKSNLQINQ